MSNNHLVVLVSISVYAQLIRMFNVKWRNSKFQLSTMVATSCEWLFKYTFKLLKYDVKGSSCSALSTAQWPHVASGQHTG